MAARPRIELHVLHEIVARLVECHPAGVNADVDAHANSAHHLSLQLVEILRRRIEAVGRPGTGSAISSSAYSPQPSAASESLHIDDESSTAPGVSHRMLEI